MPLASRTQYSPKSNETNAIFTRFELPLSLSSPVVKPVSRTPAAGRHHEGCETTIGSALAQVIAVTKPPNNKSVSAYFARQPGMYVCNGDTRNVSPEGSLSFEQRCICITCVYTNPIHTQNTGTRGVN